MTANATAVRDRQAEMRAAPNPRILTGRFGASPHVLGVPQRAFLRFPVCPPVPPRRPPSAGFPPAGDLRLGPFGRHCRFRFPVGSLRVAVPLSTVQRSAATARFRGRWSRTAGTNVISAAATASPGPRSARARMGSGWHDGMPPANRLSRAAASAQDRCARTAQNGGSPACARGTVIHGQ